MELHRARSVHLAQPYIFILVTLLRCILHCIFCFTCLFGNNYRFTGSFKNSTERSMYPSSSFPQLLHLTKLQYSIKTRKLTLIECVGIVACFFFLCVDSGNHYHTQNAELSCHHNDLPCATPLYSYLPLLSPPPPIPDND